MDSLLWLVDPLLLNVSAPLSVPLLVGAKTTLKVTLCPALMVNGNEAPAIVYCELLLDAEFTVTLPPVAVMLAGCVELLPTSTLPKLSVDGLRLSVPVVFVVPVPLSGILICGPEMNTLPPDMPETWGSNAMLREMLLPGLSTTGNDGPLTENPRPVVCKALNVTFHENGLVNTTDWLVLTPTATDPNETLAGEALTP